MSLAPLDVEGVGTLGGGGLPWSAATAWHCIAQPRLLSCLPPADTTPIDT